MNAVRMQVHITYMNAVCMQVHITYMNAVCMQVHETYMNAVCIINPRKQTSAQQKIEENSTKQKRIRKLARCSDQHRHKIVYITRTFSHIYIYVFV